MRYLLDTHFFIWLMEGGGKISPKVTLLLKDSANEIFVSVATVWEIIIKKSKGRLRTPKDIKGGIYKAGFKILPIEISHALEIEKLPLYQDHKDPFDRMLISQAKAEDVTLITADPKMWQYPISCIRA